MTILTTLRRRWCALVHDSPMLPIHSTWRCRRCLCEFLVEWGAGEAGR